MDKKLIILLFIAVVTVSQFTYPIFSKVFTRASVAEAKSSAESSAPVSSESTSAASAAPVASTSSTASEASATPAAPSTPSVPEELPWGNSSYYEGFGDQPDVHDVLGYFYVLRKYREGINRRMTMNAFLFYGENDDDQEALAKIIAEKEGAIIKILDIDEIMKKLGGMKVLLQIYSEAIIEAKQNEKLVIIYFKNVKKDMEYGWCINPFIDRNNRNPYLVTIMQVNELSDINDASKSRSKIVEVKSPNKKTRADRINLEARNKIGQEFSAGYTKLLALCSSGASSEKIGRAFEKQCQNSDKDKCSINKFKLFHEFAKQHYVTTGVLLCAIGCISYGLHHSVTSGWVKQIFKYGNQGAKD